MKIFLSPQATDEKNFKYSFEGDIMTVEFRGATDTFDFTPFPDGKLSLFDENGDYTVETDLEVMPISEARREDGVLYLEILNFISQDAPYEERFPEWIDADDYVFKENEPEEEEEDGEAELEE